MKNKEAQAFVELSTEEIRNKLINCKVQYKTAKENYEFEQASMLLADINILQKEINRRNG